MLDEKRALKGVEVQRITFNEITRSAVRAAMAHPRDLDQPLIDAYLARRALDYLVGFTLSPVLWRKLPGSRSAGRVQSVALRLICEREAEIEAFRAARILDGRGAVHHAGRRAFTARLTHLDGKQLDQFDLPDEARRLRAKAAVEAGSSRVGSVEKQAGQAQPAAAVHHLHLAAGGVAASSASARRQTMRLAQQLYEGVDIGGETVGLITYMRTDGVQMAREAIVAIRDHVGESYRRRLPARRARANTPAKAKNAQEAHEAIRPTDVARTPESVARYLDAEQRRLYELIWKRAVASQMQSAELDQVTVEIVDRRQGHAGCAPPARSSPSTASSSSTARTRTTRRRTEDETAAMLPPMAERDPLERGDGRPPRQHFTQPPPRYSEASLVKKMEELGIGRPSTYASILSVLQDRNYVRLEKRRFIPEDRGRLVTAFLVELLRALRRYRLHRLARGPARRHLRRAAPTGAR